MPQIKAFQGLRYNSSKIKDLSRVLAPPYDVISATSRDAFYSKHPENVIRLILGKDEKSDSAVANKYTRAKKFLSEWINKSVLVKEPAPAIYIYVQDYKEAGKNQRRVGFLAAMKIDEKAVLKHENTLASPKKDRMALLKQVRTNLSPIFGLFQDKPGRVQKILNQACHKSPAIDVTIDGVRHRIYVDSHAGHVKDLSRAMATKSMFIADGHHRFEVACQFKNWMRSKFPKAQGAGWEYVMTYFSDCESNPFKIFPTHRLLRLKNLNNNALEILETKGQLRKVNSLADVLKRLSKNREESGERSYPFGIYFKGGFYIFTLNDRLTADVQKNPVERLDVSVLHKKIVEPCFKIKAIEKSEAIDFTRDAQEAVSRVKSGEFDMAVFLRPTSLKEMIDVSKKGLKMPQKSTYFYPKLLSGLVFHKFDDAKP